GSAMAYVDRGNIYLMHFPNLGGSARQDFEAAIRVEPTNPYAWYGRAATWSGVTFQVFTGARDYDPRAAIAAQIADVTEAIHLKPDFALAHASRGILHLSRAMSEMRTVQVQSDSAQGKADIERAFALKPSLRPRIDAEIEALKSLPAFDARIRQTMAQLRASLQFDPAPFRSRSGGSADSCPNYRGGAANACRANDWMATERYNGGSATRKDREKYGDY
ncbi:MAG: hypothetical protein ACREVB_12980, partial [Burkholderiales bacterium]